MKLMISTCVNVLTEPCIRLDWEGRARVFVWLGQSSIYGQWTETEGQWQEHQVITNFSVNTIMNNFVLRHRTTVTR